MQFKQKRSIFRTSFDFGEEELSYTFDNSRTKVGGSIPYHKISDRTSYREIKLWWVQYVFVFFFVLCMVTGFHYGNVEGIYAIANIGLYLLGPFLICAAAMLMRKPTGLTTIPAQPVAIYILHDDKRQKIFDEIMKRRIDRIRQKLIQVDFNRPYYDELKRFTLLREEGIISEQEYRAARQKIAAMRNKVAVSHPGPGAMN